MGKLLTKIKRRKEARKELDSIEEKRDLAMIIHYSCESFYDIKDGRTPRVTSIAVRSFATAQTTSFSIHKSAELKGVAISAIGDHYDKLERDMLDEFFKYIGTLTVQKFIHWNMRDQNYGFQAIEHRYKILGGTPVSVSDSRKFDLARGLVALYGVGYTPHGENGRLHSIMEINSISARDALTGAQEAKAFEDGEFVKLHQSTLRKVDVIANLLERTLDGSLKTSATWTEKHGLHPQVIVEIVKEHWAWSLLVMVATAWALGSRVFGLF